MALALLMFLHMDNGTSSHSHRLLLMQTLGVNDVAQGLELLISASMNFPLMSSP
jgi:hypothetical protein